MNRCDLDRSAVRVSHSNMMIILLSSPVLFCIVLFAALLICVELGRRLGLHWDRVGPDGEQTGTAALDGAIFALFGLLMAFTFSGAAERFDARRGLIVQEANAISTAYLRVDLAPANDQPALRDAFRQYVDSRLEAYNHVADVDAFRTALGKSAAIQNQIWKLVIADGQEAGAQPGVDSQLLPAVNDMISITTTRAMAMQMHPPTIVYVLLLGLALASALLAGYGMGEAHARSWLHVLIFAAILTVALYVIVDFEHPRLGTMRVDNFDSLLSDVRASMR
jgi:hypothetical protein